MVEPITCIICKFCDPSECHGYKWYCEWYRTYEDPGKAKECPYFSNNSTNFKKRQV